MYSQFRSSAKKIMFITRGLASEEMFDRMPPLPFKDDFWELLLCRGGRLVDLIFVDIDGHLSDSVSGDHAHSARPTLPMPATYRWYPRSLLKTLLLVRGAILLAQIFF